MGVCVLTPLLRVKGGRVGVSVRKGISLPHTVYSQQLPSHSSLLPKPKYDFTKETVLCFLSCFDYFTLFFMTNSAQLREHGVWLIAFLSVFQQIKLL